MTDIGQFTTSKICTRKNVRMAARSKLMKGTSVKSSQMHHRRFGSVTRQIITCDRDLVLGGSWFSTFAGVL